MSKRADAVIRAKPEVIGIASLFFGFALFFLMPSKLASAISSAIFFTGFVYGVIAYSKTDGKGRTRILVAVTVMCLVASVGLGYVTF